TNTQPTQQPPQTWQSNRAGVNTQNTKEQRNHTNHNLTPQHPKRHHGNQACGLMLASTIQFSHNTPHQPNNHEYRITTAAPRADYNQGTMPQTPNNAPSTHPYAINAYVLVNPSPWLRCISTRLSFGGSKSIAYINHQPHNKPCGLQHQLVLIKAP
ncbi:hypothetical protein, partial [Corynebacterium aurimucosum]|uniref:hypothetical protein n=1 Tax=Corynebacterium aurimucosum TaxID=169292 RepID=UPI0019553E9D